MSLSERCTQCIHVHHKLLHGYVQMYRFAFQIQKPAILISSISSLQGAGNNMMNNDILSKPVLHQTTNKTTQKPNQHKPSNPSTAGSHSQLSFIDTEPSRLPTSFDRRNQRLPLSLLNHVADYLRATADSTILQALQHVRQRFFISSIFLCFIFSLSLFCLHF